MKPPDPRTITNRTDMACCVVHAEISMQSGQRDHYSDLVLKRAIDAFEDALVTNAERLGGKRGAWKDHTGEFIFSNEGKDGFGNSCQAALQMLDQLPTVKRDSQLSDDLGQQIVIRLVCDAGPIDCERDGPAATDEIAAIRKNWASVSMSNEVIISERVFRKLNESLKSRFQKWNHCAELGMDFFVAGDRSPPDGAIIGQLPDSAKISAPEQSAQTLLSLRSRQSNSVRMQPSGILTSRTALIAGAVALLILVTFAVARYRPGSAPAVDSTPQYQELVQSDDWRNWRKQVHEKLSAGRVTESVLADALRIKMPARPESAPEALRRDQAIADAFMSYSAVRAILQLRFGISEDGFLGTGLSKPVKTKDYGAAAVHEYLIQNYPDYHPAVWMRILDPNKNPKDMTMTVQELLENDPNPDPQKKSLVEGIAQRVREKDMGSPAVIRFAILDLSKYSYSHKLGRKEASRVFMSNLAEVWNSRVRDAANLSGHTFTKGDSLYVWVFLPATADEVVPATWGELFKNLPAWLDEASKIN